MKEGEYESLFHMGDQCNVSLMKLMLIRMYEKLYLMISKPKADKFGTGRCFWLFRVDWGRESHFWLLSMWSPEWMCVVDRSWPCQGTYSHTYEKMVKPPPNSGWGSEKWWSLSWESECGLVVCAENVLQACLQVNLLEAFSQLRVSLPNWLACVKLTLKTSQNTLVLMNGDRT